MPSSKNGELKSRTRDLISNREVLPRSISRSGAFSILSTTHEKNPSEGDASAVEVHALTVGAPLYCFGADLHRTFQRLSCRRCMFASLLAVRLRASVHAAPIFSQSKQMLFGYRATSCWHNFRRGIPVRYGRCDQPACLTSHAAGFEVGVLHVDKSVVHDIRPGVGRRGVTNNSMTD